MTGGFTECPTQSDAPHQSFTYDALSRLTGSSGLAGVARTYGYDLDGNRVSFTLGSDSYAVAFDRTDAATGTRKNGGASVAFAWDRYGNLLADASAGTTAGLVTYGYDLADRTTSITRAGTTTTLALDALGRPRTRTTGASVDTMTYEGASNIVLRVANAGGSGTTTDGITDAAGTRLGTRVGSGSRAWLVPDLHGSVAAGLSLAATAVTDALRYDGYGVTLAVHAGAGSGATAHWRYGGRLDLVPGSPDPAVPSLYDFGFREYAPSVGAFTSLDDLVGSAQDPGSLNRFLYAAANPATLIDPDGHDACVGSECDNATYDDGHEGNDYCVGNCGQSTTETGPGDSGYTGYTPPPTAPSAPRTGSPASSTPVVSQPRPGMPTAALWFELTHPFRPAAFTVLPYGEVNAWDPVLQLAYGRLKGSRGRAILEAHDFSYAGFLDLFNVVDLEYHGRDPVAYDADFWTGAWSPNVYLTDRDRQTMDRYPDLIAGSGGSDPGRLLAMLSLVGAGGSDRGTAPGGTRLTGGARPGSRGSPATRAHIDQVRDEFLATHPGWEHVAGGTDRVLRIRKTEEYIPGPGGGRWGSARPDLTFRGPNGEIHRINTADILRSGQFTPREVRAMLKIMGLKPNDTFGMIPKP